MKFLLLIFAIVAAASAFRVKTDFEVQGAGLLCIAKHMVPIEYVKNILHNVYPDVPKVQKYLYCNLKVLGLIEKEEISVDNVTQQFRYEMPYDEAYPIIEKCLKDTKTSDNIKEWDTKFMTCFVNSPAGLTFKQKFGKPVSE